jgi:hypothetical protein
MTNIKETRTLLDNNMVKVIVEQDIPRYRAQAHYASFCDSVVQDFKDNCKIWAFRSREGFDHLNTGEDWEPSRESVVKDIELFQQYLDKTYGTGKYEAYALGAYIHSDVSFAFNKGEDTRCRWDSGTCGFIGVPKEGWYNDLNKAASDLSDAWNGYIISYSVFDEYTHECIDFNDSLSDDIKDWMKQTEQEYNISWEGVEPIC